MSPKQYQFSLPEIRGHRVWYNEDLRLLLMMIPISLNILSDIGNCHAFCVTVLIQPVSILRYLQHIRHSSNYNFCERGREVRLLHWKMCQIPQNPQHFLPCQDCTYLYITSINCWVRKPGTEYVRKKLNHSADLETKVSGLQTTPGLLNRYCFYKIFHSSTTAVFCQRLSALGSAEKGGFGVGEHR